MRTLGREKLDVEVGVMMLLSLILEFGTYTGVLWG